MGFFLKQCCFFIFQSSDDNEPSEQKDLFVAQLYKFMDDRSKSIRNIEKSAFKGCHYFSILFNFCLADLHFYDKCVRCVYLYITH